MADEKTTPDALGSQGGDWPTVLRPFLYPDLDENDDGDDQWFIVCKVPVSREPKDGKRGTAEQYDPADMLSLLAALGVPARTREQVPEPTDADVMAWVERHNLNLSSVTDARCAFEDARSLTALGVPAREGA